MVLLNTHPSKSFLKNLRHVFVFSCRGQQARAGTMPWAPSSWPYRGPKEMRGRGGMEPGQPPSSTLASLTDHLELPSERVSSKSDSLQACRNIKI